jgi:cardiolipin synthase
MTPRRTAGKERRVVLTYANQLTILRMIFIPCFVLLVIYGHIGVATLLFVLAGVTDALDGLLARKFEQKTALGSFLDPMADKLLLTASFVTLTIPAVPVTVHIPIWLTVLTIHLQTGHASFPPSFLGKCTTTAQLTTVGVCMAVNLVPSLGVVFFHVAVYSTLLLTVVSGLHYFYRSVRIIESYQKTQPVDDKKRSQDTRG